MSQLTKLRAEHDKISARTKQMLEQFPGNKWGSDQQNEWDGLLVRVGQVHAEIDAINEATQRAGDTWRDEHGQGIKTLHTAGDFRAHYAQKSQGATRGEAIQISDFLRGVAGMRSSDGVQAALAGGTDGSGGYALPSTVMPNILEALVPASTVLTAGAGVVLLADGAKTFTTACVDNIPTAAWRLESGAVAESEPTFRAVVAAPRSLAFYFKISRELLSDAQNMNVALNIAIAQAFAKEIDRAGLRGTGTNPEPRGLLNTAGVAILTNGANGAALSGYEHFFRAMESLLQADAPQPTAAIMAPRSIVKLGNLKDSTGQWLRRPDMLSSMQMLATSNVPVNLTVGTSNDCTEIYMGDFSRMTYMMRENLSIQMLQEKFATTGEIGFVCHARVDVAVQYPQAFAIATGVRA